MSENGNGRGVAWKWVGATAVTALCGATMAWVGTTSSYIDRLREANSRLEARVTALEQTNADHHHQILESRMDAVETGVAILFNTHEIAQRRK